MASNGEIESEDNEITENNDDKVVTMMDVLQEQQDFEEDANAVLGASDDKNCTYPLGYIKRQAIYACMTCCMDAKDDPTKRAGVCLACSLNCHENHELIELYTKRNFRCDCGNPKFNSHPCQFTSNKTDLNEENTYNQNFSGVYCICHRPYPDPEATVEDEMIQCIICEDWLHASHLDATVPSVQYDEMICKACMEKNEFLNNYLEFSVNLDNDSVDVTTVETEKSENNYNKISEENPHDTKHETGNIVIEPNNVDLEDKVNTEETTSENTDTTKDSLVLNEPNDQQNSENNTSVEVLNTDIENKESNNEETIDSHINDLNELITTSEDSELQNTACETVRSIEDNAVAVENNGEVVQTQVDEHNIIKSDNETDASLNAVSDDTSNELSSTLDAEKIISSDNTITTNSITEKVSEEKDNNQTLIKTSEENDDSAEEIKLDMQPNISTVLESSLHESITNETSTKMDIADEQNTIEMSLGSANHDISMDLSKEVIEGNPSKTDTINNESDAVSAVDKIDDGTPTVENSPNQSEFETANSISEETIKLTDTSDESGNNTSQTDKTMEHINTLEDTNEKNHVKRKLNSENELLNVEAKKRKVDPTECIRPKHYHKYSKGATFWPSNFRQKLCTCSECLRMYKDLSVMFLIDSEDTVSAYESLGKEKTNGKPASQYEKGLQALSSLDRIQQINVLTEYNKMRDKFLDFLKSFKDRRKIVTEEDVKAFFAGMKPKRRPDGVYFCR